MIDEVLRDLAWIRADHEFDDSPEQAWPAMRERLSEVPVDDPGWFALFVSQPGSWKHPAKFVVDPNLHGEAEKSDPKTPGLFQRIVEEFKRGVLNIDQFGEALRRLARRCTSDEFRFYRDVLEQNLTLPCSVHLLNQFAPESYRLVPPDMPKIVDLPGIQMRLPLTDVVIENYPGEWRRIFVEPGPRMVRRSYDSDTNPMDATWFEDLNWTNKKVLRGIERYEFVQAADQMELRDVRMARPNLLVQMARCQDVWEAQEGDQFSRVERELIEPHNLLAHLALIRSCQFPAFNIVLGNADAITVRFDRNPKIIVEDSILITLDPLIPTG